MGWEIHITRAENWYDSDQHPITAEEWLALVQADPELTIELFASVLYRNKGAYLIGRIFTRDEQWPLAIPLLHREGKGIVADALITDEAEVSIIFSFTRSYFMVEVPIPLEFIGFLKRILPGKHIAELYTSIGFYKQGKSEFYRALINHLAYVDLVEGGSIDVAISPQQSTVSALLAHVRRGDVVKVYSLRRGAAEAIEAVAHGDRKSSRVVGRRLDEIELPPGTTIGAIVRGDDVLIAHHNTVIEAEDHVILFIVNKKNAKAVEKLFQVGVGFV